MLSNNGLAGSIPTEVGNLKNLKEIMLDQNSLAGSIPIELFHASRIELLMLQSNRLTGSIPTQLGNLQNATRILMNHNSLKGAIPNEIQNLMKIEFVHFHHNQLTGTAPLVEFVIKSRENFITDCGDPSYLLPEKVKCTSCTMCCNSEGACQTKTNLRIDISTLTIVVFITIPIGIAIFAFGLKRVQRIPFFSYFKDVRDPVKLYKEDSVYCFILSSDPKAWIVYFITAVIQILLIITFLLASSSSNEFSDNSFPFICPNNSMVCESKDDNSVEKIDGLCSLLL